MTEAQEIQPGVHLARVVVDDHADSRVRIVNLSENLVRLTKDQMLGGLHPVEVETNKQNDENVGPIDAVTPSEMLLADLPDDTTPEIRERLSEKPVEYGDDFSVTDRDLGRTSVCKHKIETGDARPVQQLLRRRPLSRKIAVGEQLTIVLAVGILLVFFLVIVGSVTENTGAIPRDKRETTSVVKALVEHRVVRHGAPPQVMADRVKILVGNPFREFCRLLGIDQLMTSSYRLSGNGLIGCFFQALGAMMGEVIAAIKGDCLEVLPRVHAASMTRDRSWNAVASSTTGYASRRAPARLSLMSINFASASTRAWTTRGATSLLKTLSSTPCRLWTMGDRSGRCAYPPVSARFFGTLNDVDLE